MSNVRTEEGKLDGFQFGTVAEAVLPDGSQAFRKGYPRQVLTAVESPGIVGAGSESLDITGQCDLLKIGLAGEVHRKFGRGEGSFTQIDDRTVCEVACNRGEFFGREGRFAQGNDFQVSRSARSAGSSATPASVMKNAPEFLQSDLAICVERRSVWPGVSVLPDLVCR